MSLEVVTTPEADAQIVAIDEWWRANRSAAPNLFREELGHCFALPSQAPQIGTCSRRHRAIPDTRRVLLRATRYHVYDVPLQVILLVLAVWHSQRGWKPTV